MLAAKGQSTPHSINVIIPLVKVRVKFFQQKHKKNKGNLPKTSNSAKKGLVFYET